MRLRAAFSDADDVDLDEVQTAKYFEDKAALNGGRVIVGAFREYAVGTELVVGGVVTRVTRRAGLDDAANQKTPAGAQPRGTWSAPFYYELEAID